MSLSAKAAAAATDPLAQRLYGLVRRMVATATGSSRWQLAGARGADGATEAVRAEVFAGVGFAARPPSGATAEVVVVNVGGRAGVPVVVAARDQKTRAAVLAAIGDLEPGDTLVHNAAAIVLLKADGTVEVRTPGGTALPLATKADLEALRTWILTHAHTGVTTGGGASGPPATTAPSPAGTSVLKGQ